MKTFSYFAYGSNMLTHRLQARCPSALPIGVAVAAGYCLEFSKRSIDGSGKATLEEVAVPEQQAFGVLFEIETRHLPALDKAEGKGNGYDRFENFSVTIIDNMARAEVTTYLASASAMDAELVPFDWYKDLVICGAVQHGLPESYIADLRNFTSQADPKLDRKSRRDAIAALNLAGLSCDAG